MSGLMGGGVGDGATRKATRGTRAGALRNATHDGLVESQPAGHLQPRQRPYPTPAIGFRALGPSFAAGHVTGLAVRSFAAGGISLDSASSLLHATP